MYSKTIKVENSLMHTMQKDKVSKITENQIYGQGSDNKLIQYYVVYLAWLA